MNEEDWRQLSNSAYEILCYLETHQIIMLTDVLRLSNIYKVNFSTFDKSWQSLHEEFDHFIDSTQSASASKTETIKQEIATNPKCVKQFFLLLNNGMSILDITRELSKTEDMQ